MKNNNFWQQVRALTVRLLLPAAMVAIGCLGTVKAGSTHPFYRRRTPAAQNQQDFSGDTTHVDLTSAHTPPFGASNSVPEALRLFDARAAAAVSDATAIGKGVYIFPSGEPATATTELLEQKSYGDVAPTIYIPKAKCLAALAYPDFFPGANANGLRQLVSQAILASSPGWGGSYGPEVHDAITVALVDSSGDYDMTEMHLLRMAYAYYDELSPEAREQLITVLLATGRIHRPDEDDIVTSGRAPDDWSRAGYISPLGDHIRIGETENHILMIHTARYLCNQLLYQRDHSPDHDNRRNEVRDDDNRKIAPSCTELMLGLLRNILRDDFSEYNAKPYQEETRAALLNLYSFAYDHEVRLAARMVLDYISAHIAVSSNDLRRMVPFRRRNENGGEDNHFHRTDQLGDNSGFMGVGLLDWAAGADPMTEHFAIQAGNVRAFGGPGFSWGLPGDGTEATMEALSDYRLPPSIHDLFINDGHRRFFQRLHRTARSDEVENSRNCDNMEIYAGSSSYLITAGGAPATYAIDPGPASIISPSKVAQQLGVAMTTSFMPTTRSGLAAQFAGDLIQFSTFSQQGAAFFVPFDGSAANYGVAPDFACGHKVYLPQWCLDAIKDSERFGNFSFVNKESESEGPGFYLAIYRSGEFALMEAFDTWLHPGLSYDQFRQNVVNRNSGLESLRSNVEAQYTTQNGNTLHFVIWNLSERGPTTGAAILKIDYVPSTDPADYADRLGDAGNRTDKFLNGSILNSPAEAVVEITNPFLGTKITMDMQDQWHPKRFSSENGEYEEAGNNHEVWVDFGWNGPMEGDFYRPFNTLAGALAAVADGGVIKIMPGVTREKPPITKRVKLVAPIGDVKIGVR